MTMIDLDFNLLSLSLIRRGYSEGLDRESNILYNIR